MIWLLLAVLVLLVLLFLGRAFANRNITQYTVDEVRTRLNGEKAILLDVRTDSERKAKSIPGSLHIPLQELSQSLERLEKYRDKEIICYCRTGNRSVAAADVLGKQNFKAASMKGGITAWTPLPGEDSRRRRDGVGKKGT